MKRAVTVAFHSADNYGAVLQALALQEHLKKHFDQVQILDYVSESITNAYSTVQFSSPRALVSSLFRLRTRWTLRRKFQTFRKKWLHLLPHSSGQCITVDHIFVGSDQIWNPEITGGVDPMYFGQIESVCAAKRTSYGASIGVSTLPDSILVAMQPLLKRLDSISVREDAARRLVAPLVAEAVEVVLDPTLLLSKQEWERFVSPCEKKRYLLVYSLAGYSETMELARRAALSLDLELLEVSSSTSKLFSKFTHSVISTASPSEFLGLIAGAGFVVTDSFHGTVFSVLFEKPFYTVPHRTRGARTAEFLYRLGLQRRLSNDADVVIDDDIDYCIARELLQEEISRSKDFIKRAVDK